MQARKRVQVLGIMLGAQHAGLDHRKHKGGLPGEQWGRLMEDGVNA